MLVGASPDAILVSPWLGGRTPNSTAAVSPWDTIAPSPAPIRASRSAGSRSGGKYNQVAFSVNKLKYAEDGEDDLDDGSKDHNHEISESMCLEMDLLTRSLIIGIRLVHQLSCLYDGMTRSALSNSICNFSMIEFADWVILAVLYDREEGGIIYDADSFSLFLGEEASFQKKEAELAKSLIRRDGSKMTLSQIKKLSQLAADNTQWEDRQLMRSGAVRGTEVHTTFDDENERKVILLVHDTKPPFLDGRIAFTKQAEPIMPLKDPTSDMAIISRKGSTLVKEIHEKQSMNISLQHFWELAGSKLGDILGVEKMAEQIDADTAVVGEQDEVDFKEDAKFTQHLKKGEAVSDFARSKYLEHLTGKRTLSQQRQYLPIFSVREELLQVIRENQVVVVVGKTGSGMTTQLTQLWVLGALNNVGGLTELGWNMI